MLEWYSNLLATPISQTGDIVSVVCGFRMRERDAVVNKRDLRLPPVPASPVILYLIIRIFFSRALFS